MIQHGVFKVRPDARDFSHSRSFGSVTPQVFSDELDLDCGLTNLSQNAIGMANGCTGMTQSDICTDEDKVVYKPQFTYLKTQIMEGTAGQDVGCDIRDSLQSTITFGVQAQNETTDAQALTHARSAYYAIEPAPDYFDSIRTVLLQGKPVSIATQWFSAFEQPDSNGVLSAPINWSENASYHNYKCCGWKTIGGIPYLTIKSWQGPQYAQAGFCYMPRDLINNLLNQTFTGAFVLDHLLANTQPVQTYALYEKLIGVLWRIYISLRDSVKL